MIKNSELSFLIVGLGSIGKRHLRNLAKLGITNLSVLSKSRNLLPDDNLPQFSLETSLTEALNKKPTAVIIANPTSLHMKIALKAAAAKCHLFIEKPISHTMDGVEELQKFVKQHNLKVQTGFQFRFHPSLQTIKKWLKNDTIGKVVSVHVHWGEYLPSWHPWEDYRSGYSARQDLGGGVVLTLSHPFDYLRWLFGKITNIYAMIDKLSDLELDTEDAAQVSFRFKSGIIGSVYLDYIEQPPKHNLIIIGQKGKIYWDNANSIAILYYANNSKQIFEPPSDFERNTLFLNEMSHFIDCIKKNQQPRCNLKDGIRALQIALAIKQSSLEKREIQV
jgi:predicted dehydrogenase